MSWENSITSTPRAFDIKRAQTLMETLNVQESATRDLLIGAFGNSDYLTRIVRTQPDILDHVLSDKPEKILTQILQTVAQAAHIKDRNEFMRILRQQKSRAALLIALADIANIWPLEKVMKANTLFADQCARATLEHLTDNQGAVLIAMGKYGAGELNYSSDIDIIFFYQPEAGTSPEQAAKFFPALARDFVHILQARTQEGYVFRVDLSLRPDPGTTQAAVSLNAAQQYYESVGQNWERAAFIKARPAAGNIQAGQKFLSEMKAFIWRKYLDFAVLEDIHAMKRQAHAAIGLDEKERELKGRDIKRAAGGIRDIEMFVQSQQLIAGGRDILLRRPQTCAMLSRLAARKWITKQAARDLIGAYRFLRHVEHRLQMVADEQTHKLPVSDEDFTHIALFAGFPDKDAFRQKLTAEMDIVRAHYADLFSQSPSLGAETGSLIFTGGEDDPETLQSLRDMGFAQASTITRIVRKWHSGRIRAMRSQRARELLTALLPSFLKQFAQTSEPDAAFLRFDKFLSSLSVAVQFFSLLQSHPAMINFIALICGTAPLLADKLAQHPRMIEAMFEAAPENLKEDLHHQISHHKDYEAVLDHVRVWAREQQFHVGARILENQYDALEAAQQFSSIAETIIAAMQKQVDAAFREKYGVIKNSAMSIIAAGSLGAQEMTSLSDLDLIFVYQADDPSLVSDGAKQIPARLYYARMAQMLIQALTATTATGALYDVDMRLRPSGKAGPVAVMLESFDEYQHNKAWVWEHMALTRMRPITGPENLRLKISAIIKNVLCQKRNPETIAHEVSQMRQTILQAHGTLDGAHQPQRVWDISFTPGGLLDAEFICQYLQLIHAAEHPDILSTSTLKALANITETGLHDLSPVYEAVIFFKTLVQPLHLSVGRIGDDADIPPPLQYILARAAQRETFAQVQAQLTDHLSHIKDIFQNLRRIGPPQTL